MGFTCFLARGDIPVCSPVLTFTYLNTLNIIRLVSEYTIKVLSDNRINILGNVVFVMKVVT